MAVALTWAWIPKLRGVRSDGAEWARCHGTGRCDLGKHVQLALGV